MRVAAIRQRALFEQAPTAPTVQLPPEAQEQLKDALVRWLQALAKALNEEHGDEQDHR
jgi:hypothetical protein